MNAQRIAARLSPVQRRVLYELGREREPMTINHLHSELLHTFVTGRHGARVRWPSQQIRSLSRAGLLSSDLVKWFQEGTRHVHLMIALTNSGKEVARYCYYDGGCANA